MVERLGFGVTEQLLGRTVEDPDAAGGIEADHPGSDPGKHRLGEASALSISSLARTSSSRWERNSCVILLKVSPS